MELDSSIVSSHGEHDLINSSAGITGPYSMSNLLMRREHIKPTISPALLSAIDHITAAENELKHPMTLSSVKRQEEIDNSLLERQVTPPYLLESLGQDTSQNSDFNLLHHVGSDASLFSHSSLNSLNATPTPGHRISPSNDEIQHRPFYCEDCGKGFQNNSALVKHKLIHSDERHYTCPVCEKAFKRQDHLTGHMNVHKSVKPFVCVIGSCDKSYCDARSLRRHLEHGHNIRNPTVHSLKGTMYIKCGDGEEFSVPMNSISPSPLTIDKLNRERNSSGDTGSSRSTQDISPTSITGYSHSSGSSSSEKFQERVECGQCGRTFKNVPALNGHMRLHSNSHHRDRLPSASNTIQPLINADTSAAGQPSSVNSQIQPLLASVPTTYNLLNYGNHHGLFPDIAHQATLPYVSTFGAIQYGDDIITHNAMTHHAQDTIATQTDIVASMASTNVVPGLLEPLSLINTSQEVLSAPATMLSSAANLSQPTSPGSGTHVHNETIHVQCPTTVDPLANIDLCAELQPDVDDESIKKELETLALTQNFGDIGNFDGEPYNNDVFEPRPDYSSQFHQMEQVQSAPVPERRRHMTAPCRLSNQSKPNQGPVHCPTLSMLRQRRRSKGKPENVCQLLTSGEKSRNSSGTSLNRSWTTHTEPKLRRRNSTGRPRSRPVFNLNETGRKAQQKAKPPPLALPQLNRYPSQLRSPRFWEGAPDGSKSPPPYTPPPILSPMRHGPGLFWTINRHLSGQLSCSVNAGSQFLSSFLGVGPPKSAPLAGPQGGFWQSRLSKDIDEGRMFENHRLSTNQQPDELDDVTGEMLLEDLADTTCTPIEEPPTTDTNPHINVGCQFQAFVPEWQGEPATNYEVTVGEQLVFEPSCLDDINETTLDMFMRLSCSSALYGGARNKELAMHLICKHRGNIEAALVELISANPTQVDQQSDGLIFNEHTYWSPEEIKEFQTALCKHEKDFYLIANELIGGKSVRECVSFYYTWKKVCPEDYRKYRGVRRKRQLLEIQPEGVNVRKLSSMSYNLRSKAIDEDEKQIRQSNNEQVETDEQQSPARKDSQTSVRFADTSPTPKKYGRKTKTQGTKVKKGAIPSLDGLFHCQLCPKAFPKVKSLNAHMKSHSCKREQN